VRLLFLHGIGGPLPHEDWLAPLNHELGSLGYPDVDPEVVIDPGYDDILRSGPAPATSAPPTTAEAPETANERARDDYELRRQLVSARLAPVMGVESSVLSTIPEGDYLANRMPQVRAYMDNRDLRHALWHRVLEAIEDHRDLIILAHSLGSAIAADLVDKLAEGTRVRALVTLGSPLGSVPGLRRRIGWMQRSFPYTVLHSWVNVFDPRDPITGGRGLAHHIAPVVDVPVMINRHAALAYCNHPATATAVGMAAEDVRTRPVARVRQRHPTDPAWTALLLRFGLAQQLANEIPPTAARQRQRLTLARLELARRAHESVVAALDHVRAAHRRTRGQERQVVSRCREVLRSAPSESELDHHAMSMLRGSLSLDDCVIVAVAMLEGRPMPPFEIDLSVPQRRSALGTVLARVADEDAIAHLAGRAAHDPSPATVPRSPMALDTADDSSTDGVPLTDRCATQLVDAAVEARARAVREMIRVPRLRDDPSTLGPLAARILTSAGSPTDLAGLAVRATQQATLGPRGLAAGVCALGILAQEPGTPLAAAGLAGAEAGIARALDPMLQDTVLDQSIDQLQTTMVALVAVVMTRLSLGLPDGIDQIRQVVLVMLHRARGELAVHDRVAPGTRTTRGWRSKVRVLERCERWLDKTYDASRR
jgi:hypothetical protein